MAEERILKNKYLLKKRAKKDTGKLYKTRVKIVNNGGESGESTMLTDMTPSAGQFYGGQIPSMGMNIGSHIQKPTVSVSAVSAPILSIYIP